MTDVGDEENNALVHAENHHGRAAADAGNDVCEAEDDADEHAVEHLTKAFLFIPCMELRVGFRFGLHDRFLPCVI